MLFDVSDLKTNEKSVVTEKKIVRKNYSYDELVHMNRELESLRYADFDEKTYPEGILFYDFEVFMYDWMVVIIDPVNEYKKIIVNNRNALKTFFEEHKECIWTGYNNIRYDVPIMKGILLGMNPKEVSDAIIVEGKSQYMINPKFNDIDILSYDVFDKQNSLKLLEAFMGNDIRETEVPFDIDRALTQKEIAMTMKYCIHDVEQTIEVFRRRIDDFNAAKNLISMFNLEKRMIQFTKSQLTAEIIGCRTVQNRHDEFNISFVDTLRLNKYAYVKDWFIEASSKHDYSMRFETEVCGIPHQFGWGGIHGAPNEPVHLKGKIYHVDVTSYYPSMMIEYDLLTRNCTDKSKFKNVYDTRVELKKAGKKKEQAPYKIVLNSTYGICKDKYSKAYDPLMANNVCVNGQLLLLDLLEHLEGHANIIQSNTDGIICSIEDTPEADAKFKEICNEWIERTKMGLGFDEITEIHQKDVNNYIFVFSNGKVERKGAYVMELSDLSYDLPIVNEALVNYMLNGTPVENTINNCNEMIKFQKVVRISKSYKVGWHNGNYLDNKTFRVFASTDYNDTFIGKCRERGSKPEKFGNTPEHTFIYNEDIRNCPMSIKLDKKWYISLAKKRLMDFGYDLSNKLF